MIEFKTGNIFESDSLVLVNPVNTVGVMGAGLALEFKKRFPKNFRKYEQYCSANLLEVGKVFFNPNIENGHFILNFPTKRHWQDNSKLEWIEAGFRDLLIIADFYSHFSKSYAIPMLGCGLGGLVEADVIKTLDRVYNEMENKVLEEIIFSVYKFD